MKKVFLLTALSILIFSGPLSANNFGFPGLIDMLGREYLIPVTEHPILKVDYRRMNLPAGWYTLQIRTKAEQWPVPVLLQ